MNAWSHLPNASHIDWVLESLKTHTQLWQDIYNQAWEQAFSQAWWQARGQARGQAWSQALDQARYQASGVLLALIAYDDSVKYLSMTSDQLRVWARLSEDPRAVLLLSMVQVKEKIKEMELVTG